MPEANIAEYNFNLGLDIFVHSLRGSENVLQNHPTFLLAINLDALAEKIRDVIEILRNNVIVLG